MTQVTAERLRLRPDLTRLSILSTEALLSRWIAGGAALRELIPDGPLNTWDRSVLEFSAYRAMSSDWSRAEPTNLELLIAARERERSALRRELAPPGSSRATSTDLILRAMLSASQGDMARAETLAREATRLNPGDATALGMLRRYKVADGGPAAPAPKRVGDSAG
jgi:hypothetical protein